MSEQYFNFPFWIVFHHSGWIIEEINYPKEHISKFKTHQVPQNLGNIHPIFFQYRQKCGTRQVIIYAQQLHYNALGDMQKVGDKYFQT